jgi:hypothetical protein
VTVPVCQPQSPNGQVLIWDGTGSCVYSKRLEQGEFACLWRELAGQRLSLTVNELQLFLEGGKLVGNIELRPARVLAQKLPSKTGRASFVA